MGKLIHKRGDVFKSQAEILMHGCNCIGGYGAGVAGAIAKRWPKARDYYLKKHHSEGWQLGEIQACYIPSITMEKLLPLIQEETWADRSRYYPVLIVNAATQNTCGRTGVHVDYDSVRTCMEKTFDLAEIYGFGVAMPRIGSGLAGGDPDIIENIIQSTLDNYQINVEMYTL